MPTYHDDNYGTWTDTDDPDVVAFYHKVQRESVRKACNCCGRIVKIRPEYAICNACADAQERGGC